ncbi:hypothetical protein C0993_002230 [Termitomyces sp. T159_Od127]|nr:hypothetical protein C0993_002230 [Termitomyces sp. T159_Od127]
MKQWVVAILMFHFELVHVKGTFHRPNGLSRRPRQPGDPKPDLSNDDEFSDWVDRLHGFIHLIQLPIRLLRPDTPTNTLLHPIVPYTPTPFPTIDTFYTKDLNTYTQQPAVQIVEEPQPLREDSSKLTYDVVPRSAKAAKEDHCLDLMRQWMDDLKCPPQLTDDEYKSFIRYATNFFLSDNRLWHQNKDGAHKLVVKKNGCLQILHAMHDELGHCGLYTTRATLLERF